MLVVADGVVAAIATIFVQAPAVCRPRGVQAPGGRGRGRLFLHRLDLFPGARSWLSHAISPISNARDPAEQFVCWHEVQDAIAFYASQQSRGESEYDEPELRWTVSIGAQRNSTPRLRRHFHQVATQILAIRVSINFHCLVQFGCKRENLRPVRC